MESQTIGDDGRLAHHLEIDAKVAVEGGLQPRVTHRDAQRIGIVVNVKQLGDIRLLRLSTELHLKVGLRVESVAQVEGWRYVGHRTHRIDRTSKILLDVVGTLGEKRHADVHVDALADIAQLDFSSVAILRPLGIAAQTGAEVALVRVVQIAKQGRPVTIALQDLGKGGICIVGKVIGIGIVLLIAVAVSVVQLQKEALLSESARLVTAEGTTLASFSTIIPLARWRGVRGEVPQRLRVGDAQGVASIIVVRHGIAVGLIGRVIAPNVLLLIEVDSR